MEAPFHFIPVQSGLQEGRPRAPSVLSQFGTNPALIGLQAGPLLDRVFTTYKLMHTHQTVDFVNRKVQVSAPNADSEGGSFLALSRSDRALQPGPSWAMTDFCLLLAYPVWKLLT